MSYREGTPTASVVDAITRLLVARMDEDFTIVTQEDMLRTLSNILDILTMAVGHWVPISLLVGGVGIVTIMTIAVRERTGEIGLMVALGAPRRTILALLFLGEAVALSALGGIMGLVLGIGLAQLIHLAVPALPVHAAEFVLLAELVVAIAIGLAAGVLPARSAAQLDPVEHCARVNHAGVTDPPVPPPAFGFLSVLGVFGQVALTPLHWSIRRWKSGHAHSAGWCRSPCLARHQGTVGEGIGDQQKPFHVPQF